MKKKIRLLPFLCLLAVTHQAGAQESSADVTFCHTAYGETKWSLMSCYSSLAEMSKGAVSSMSESTETFELQVNSTCSALEKQLAAEGVGSGAELAIEACFTDEWAKIRDQLYKKSYY
jgi:hypothetical protein